MKSRRYVAAFLLAVTAVGIEGGASAQPQKPSSTQSSAQSASGAANASTVANASPSTKAEAARHFKRGLELFDENDYQGALIEFERAYQILPTYQVLYNIGQVHYQLQNYAGALKSFESFLSEGGDKIPADRRADVERDIAKLRARIATVEVTSSPGATIYVDDNPVGTAPLSAPIQISTGRRRLRATLPSRTPIEKTLELAGGDAVKVDLTFEPVSTGPVAQEEEPHRSPPWALWGVAGALAIGTGVTGVLALTESGTVNDLRTNGGAFTDYDDARHKMRTLSVVTDILGAATIVVVGVATYFTVASGKKSSSAAHAPLLRPGMLGSAGAHGGSFALTF